MEMNRFNKPDVILNRIGFGGWQLGNSELWGEMSEADGIALVKAAIAKGINFFDTGPGYGGGMSETIIGKAIGDDRDFILINSKFGHRADGSSDWRVEAIEPAIRESLGRLQTDYLDSVILHNPSMDILRGETGHFKELSRMKRLGLIRGFGVSIDTREELATVLDHVSLDVIEILFNVFFQSPRELFDKVKEKRIVLVAKVPLDSGWLTGKYDEHSVFDGIRARWTPEVRARRATLVKAVQAIVGSPDTSLAALAFIQSFDAISCVIPGVKNFKQMNDNLASRHVQLTPWQRAEFLSLYDRELKDHPLPW
jgi:aryl-alcohol dehydrogenase-like predicted oxidoreductase